MELPLNSNVMPSAGALVTASLAMMPLAPGLASTITGWPSRVARCAARLRARASAAAPGATGRTIRIG